MAKTYAIADLHGRHDLLVAALDAIEAHAGTEPATIVTLGDYIDRGPDSRRVIAMLMTGSRRPNDRLICLKGNHEEMMVEALAGRAELDWWLGNGGEATAKSYGGVDHIPADHVAWCRSLPMIHADGKRIFVHADFDDSRSVEEQIEERLLWGYRRRKEDCVTPLGFVVHGHTALQNGPLLLSGRLNIDTLAWATGRIVVAVFDDALAGGPVDLIAIHREGI